MAKKETSATDSESAITDLLEQEQPDAEHELKPLQLLEDEPSGRLSEDDLGASDFAEVVASVALGTRGPFSIGVYGDWGHGKTSVMRLAKQQLDQHAEHHPDSGVVTVWFNAWQYEREDHPVIPLVATIFAAVETQRHRLSTKLKPKSEPVSRLKRASHALRAMLYGLSARAKIAVPGFAEVEFGAVMKEMLDREEELNDREREHPIDPVAAQSVYFNAFTLMNELGDQVPKIVVFIDDLDRCSPKTSLTLLDNIKLAVSCPGFIYVFGVAHRVINEHVRARYAHEYNLPDHAESERYLDKIIQLPLYLPSHEQRFEAFIKRIIESKLQHASEEVTETLVGCATLLRIGSEASPRGLIRLINNLLVDHRLYDIAKDRAEGETVIATKQFIRSCAVSRILRSTLSDRCYRYLSESEEICEALKEHPVERLKNLLLQDGEEAVSIFDPAGTRERTILAIERLPFIRQLLHEKAAQEWLASGRIRRQIDNFLVETREASAASRSSTSTINATVPTYEYERIQLWLDSMVPEAVGDVILSSLDSMEKIKDKALKIDLQEKTRKRKRIRFIVDNENTSKLIIKASRSIQSKTGISDPGLFKIIGFAVEDAFHRHSDFDG
ncbi:MAG: P-loop NTPase fold protein [Planctomycetota bacterium]